MQHLLAKRERIAPYVLEQVGDETVIGSFRPQGDTTAPERYQVLTLRDGKIVDMQGCRSRREAERLARRRSRA